MDPLFFCELTMNSSSFSRNHYKSTIFCGFTVDPICRANSIGLETRTYFRNSSIPNTVFCQKRSNGVITGQPLRTFNELIWPQSILNLNSRPKTYTESTYMFIAYNWIEQTDLTLFWRVWPNFDIWFFMTLYDLIWPQIILNFNPRQTSEPKHMYIGYISNTPPDLTLIRRFDPSLTSGGKRSWIMIYTDSESVKNFRSFEGYVFKIGQLGGALEQFSGFRSICSIAPPSDRRT